MANSTCMICTDILDTNQEPTCSPASCGHVFHFECMQEWVLTKAKCICSVRMTREGIRDLFFTENAVNQINDQTCEEGKSEEKEKEVNCKCSENALSREEVDKHKEAAIEMKLRCEKLSNENQALTDKLENCNGTIKMMEDLLDKSRRNTTSVKKLKTRLRRVTRRSELLKRTADLKYENIAEKARIYLAENDSLRQRLDEYRENNSTLEKSKCSLVAKNNNLRIQLQNSEQKILNLEEKLASKPEHSATSKEIIDQLKASDILINTLRFELRKVLSEKQALEKANADKAAGLQAQANTAQKDGELVKSSICKIEERPQSIKSAQSETNGEG